MDRAGLAAEYLLDARAERRVFGSIPAGAVPGSLDEELPWHGRHLRCGDRVTTGTAAPVYFANPGDHVIADFGALGRVELDWSV
jgi:hypothetical protein